MPDASFPVCLSRLNAFNGSTKPTTYPGGGTVFMKDGIVVAELPEENVEPQYEGVRVDVYDNPKDPCDTHVVEYPGGLSWNYDADPGSLVVNGREICLAEFPAGTWARVEMMPVEVEVVEMTRRDFNAEHETMLNTDDDEDEDESYDVNSGETYDELARRKNARITELQVLLDTAWGLIANVDNGEGMGQSHHGESKQTRTWVETACKFRDEYFVKIHERPSVERTNIAGAHRAQECREATHKASLLLAGAHQWFEPDWQKLCQKWLDTYATGADDRGLAPTLADYPANSAVNQCRKTAQELLETVPAAEAPESWIQKRARWMKIWGV